MIKLYAWEPSFEKKISELRVKELKKLRLINFLHASMSFIYDVVPVVVILL